jgi:hypothetical protein
MRSIGIVVVALVLVNAAIAGLRRSAAAEGDALVAAASRLAEQAETARESVERRRAIQALVARARELGEVPRDVGALRDVLVGAEHGLAIDRLSLDFRPAERLPPGLGGSRVLASLRGRFGALYDYLRRIEASFLPLALDNLTLRGDAARVTLTVQWAARWPLGEGEVPEALSETDVAALEAWLDEAPAPHLRRDIFAFARAPASVDATPPPAEPQRPEAAVPGERRELPVLTGFVMARPELEPDVRRRVLAALRYQGETRLVMVGDTLGDYVVESMEARDSVTLVRADTGEQIRLTLH